MAEHSSGQKSLKSQNLPKLWAFMATNFCIAWSIMVLGGTDFHQVRTFNSTQEAGALFQSIFEKGPLVGLSTFLAMVANGILSTKVKEILVFWRFRDPLPGTRAFSELMHSDPRIDVKQLKQSLGNFPVAPAEQNAMWYKIYKKHESKVSVQDAQRSYLLIRDMAGFCILTFCILLTVALLLSLPWRGILLCSGVLVFEYLVLMIAARNYGNRFVCHVLAEESVQMKKSRPRSSTQAIP